MDSPDQQGIGDQRAMTSPGHRLCAHDCGRLIYRNKKKFFQIFPEGFSRHVIGKSSESCVFPPGIS
jgi:hypothetical protein